MSSRRSEIEAKKLRLAELRRQREEKERQLKEPQTEKLPPRAQGSQSEVDSRSIDRLVDELVNNGTDTSKPKKEERSVGIQTEEQRNDTGEKVMYNKGTQTDPAEETEIDTEDTTQITEESLTPESESRSEPTQDPIATVDDDLLASIFATSFKILNRAIEGDQNDILQKYTNTRTSSSNNNPEPFKLIQSLQLGELIYSIDSSPHFPALISITSGKSLSIYSLEFGKFETRFTAHTKLINNQFSQFKSNFIFATGFNGKIHIWDLDSNSNTPYLTSDVSSATHSYPVFALDQVHDNNGLIITASTDGRILHWNPWILSKPAQPPIVLELPKSLSIHYDELTPTAIATIENEHGYLLVGSEDGNIYKVKRFDNKLKSDPIDKIIKAHAGPVTSLASSTDWKTLFLSTSMDWKLLLWDINQEEPLMEVYKSNAIMGCSWRPKNSTQIGFIYEDSFEILDLSIDSVTPTVKISTGVMLSSIKFTSNGSDVVLGSVKGDVFIYELSITVKSEPSKFKRAYNISG